ncbi:hypothetical protein DFH09DRAFT_1045450 [Mycena vulgaris]|nr:hypothetical protein DFH09DRAFT_1045450 [Mycena vulgaris]
MIAWDSEKSRLDTAERHRHVLGCARIPSRTTMFLDLCVELLQQIGDQLEMIDHKSLRAVCKDLSFVMEPLFFSSLALDTTRLRLGSGRHIMETLATGESGWSRYAKTLQIAPGRSEGNPVADTGSCAFWKAQDLLASALGSMEKVQTVIWHVDVGAPEWERNVISDFLRISPLLNHLHLEMRGSIDLSLTGLSHLRKLEIKTPYWLETPIVKQVSQVVSQSRSLTSLRLEGSKEWCEVWNMLGDKTSLRLTEIKAGIVTSELLAYLASYSGIEHLTLQWPDGEDASAQLADMFFQRVLPKHTKSLVELSCAAAYESRWSFGTHNVDVISQLRNLKSLDMSVNSADILLVESPLNAGDLLLRTAALLPALHRLTICAADSPGHRYARCGNPRMHHLGRVNKAIWDTMQNFTSHLPSSAVVYADRKRYELMPAERAEPQEDSESGVLLAYREIGSKPGLDWF